LLRAERQRQRCHTEVSGRRQEMVVALQNEADELRRRHSEMRTRSMELTRQLAASAASTCGQTSIEDDCHQGALSQHSDFIEARAGPDDVEVMLRGSGENSRSQLSWMGDASVPIAGAVDPSEALGSGLSSIADTSGIATSEATQSEASLSFPEDSRCSEIDRALGGSGSGRFPIGLHGSGLDGDIFDNGLHQSWDEFDFSMPLCDSPAPESTREPSLQEQGPDVRRQLAFEPSIAKTAVCGSVLAPSALIPAASALASVGTEDGRPRKLGKRVSFELPVHLGVEAALAEHSATSASASASMGPLASSSLDCAVSLADGFEDFDRMVVDASEHQPLVVHMARVDIASPCSSREECAAQCQDSPGSFAGSQFARGILAVPPLALPCRGPADSGKLVAAERMPDEPSVLDGSSSSCSSAAPLEGKPVDVGMQPMFSDMPVQPGSASPLMLPPPRARRAHPTDVPQLLHAPPDGSQQRAGVGPYGIDARRTSPRIPSPLVSASPLPTRQAAAAAVVAAAAAHAVPALPRPFPTPHSPQMQMAALPPLASYVGALAELQSTS